MAAGTISVWLESCIVMVRLMRYIQYICMYLKRSYSIDLVGSHGRVEDGGDLQQLLHCIPVCTVELLGVQFYVGLACLRAERIDHERVACGGLKVKR